MLKPAYAAIAFDLDGTLVDSAPDLFYVACLMSEALALPAVTLEDIRRWVGDGIEQLVLRILSRDMVIVPDLDRALCITAIATFKNYYLQHVSRNSRLYPNVVETLEQLRQSALSLVVLTNKARAFTLLLLKALNIGHYFDIILCGDDLSDKKPHPLPMLHILERLSLEPQQLLLVGDSKNDLLCARAAGCDRAFVTYGYHQGINAQDYGPKYILDDFGQLAKLL